MLTNNGTIDALQRAAFIIKDSSNAKDRRILLDFAFDMIAADGKITDNESELFWLLGNTWDIDIKAYLDSK